MKSLAGFSCHDLRSCWLKHLYLYYVKIWLLFKGFGMLRLPAASCVSSHSPTHQLFTFNRAPFTHDRRIGIVDVPIFDALNLESFTANKETPWPHRSPSRSSNDRRTRIKSARHKNHNSLVFFLSLFLVVIGKNLVQQITGVETSWQSWSLRAKVHHLCLVMFFFSGHLKTSVNVDLLS